MRGGRAAVVPALAAPQARLEPRSSDRPGEERLVKISAGRNAAEDPWRNLKRCW
jgi:hypothetical protein